MPVHHPGVGWGGGEALIRLVAFGHSDPELLGRCVGMCGGICRNGRHDELDVILRPLNPE